MESHDEDQSRREKDQEDLLENNKGLIQGVGHGSGKRSRNNRNQGSTGDQEMKGDGNVGILGDFRVMRRW